MGDEQITRRGSVERKAYVCNLKDGSIHQRVFLRPGEQRIPRCETHGVMVRQPNKRYLKRK